jgi:hypothetical protein
METSSTILNGTLMKKTPQQQNLLFPEFSAQKSFSFYKAPISNTKPSKEISLNSIKEIILSDIYKNITNTYREIEDVKHKSILKSEMFDYVTFSCTTSNRDSKSIKHHSNLICVDLDHVGNIDTIKNIAIKIKELSIPSLMFRSPSGDGLKLVYHIDITKGSHQEYFTALKSFFNQEVGFDIDKKCGDIVRACFLCHDPDVYFNETPVQLDRAFIDTFCTQHEDSARSSKFTNNQRESIANYSEIIAHCKTWLDKKETFSKGNRNNYITQFAGVLNRFGVPESQSLSEFESYQEADFTLKEIQATVRSVYKNTKWHNTSQFDKSEPFDFDEKIENDPVHETPLLPIEGMPDFIQDFINNYQNVYNLPRDYIAGGVLISTALGIGDKLELRGRYTNIPVIWMSIIGNVSSGKTDPLNRCLSFFNRKDTLSFQSYLKEMAIYEAEIKKSKNERDESIVEPKLFQYILNDFTPEALSQAHSTNDRGIMTYRDELKGQIDDFGRYGKSGEQSNMLSSYFQLPIKFNRKGSTPINIPKPCIFLAGGMQVDLLPSLAADNRAENGFLSRICHVFPDTSDKSYFSNLELDPVVMKEYYKYLEILTSLPEISHLTLSAEATVLYEAWFNRNADRTNEEMSGYLKGVYGKLDVISLRLAIIIHGMKLACDGEAQREITPETMEAALNITEYFRSTALKVYDTIFKEPQKNLDKKSVAKFLIGLGNQKTIVAKVLKTSRQQIDRHIK